jgi:uncharacterized membrane protein
MEAESAHIAPRRSVHPRGSDEFSRVLAFSDGLFAIAMTLLVVGIGIPDLDDADSVSDLASALYNDLGPFISFFISFAVIGRYWMAHHEFFASLRGVDSGLIRLNLLYLALIAFLPFPTGLLGDYFDNPLSIVIYAVSVAAVSGMEVVLFRHAYRRDLMATEMPEDVYRWANMLSLSPVVSFAVSIPLAFVSTTLAVVVWFSAVPFQIVANRFKPPRADEFF